jgi:hypothetical protein
LTTHTAPNPNITAPPPDGAVSSAWATWDELASLVRAFEPSVVLLLPRKPVRMREALELDFGAGALTITDLAIPFARRWLHGARVAVVDDFVNVGSTMNNAIARALEAGASEIAAFAITSGGSSAEIATTVRFACPEILNQAGMREFGRRVPETLQRIAKPYDLDFPLLQCRLRLPLNGFDTLSASLREIHGDEQVYDLSTPEGSTAGVRRLALDLTDDGHHDKVRIYFDERQSLCRVMPISIPDPVGGPRNQAWSSMAAAVWDSLREGPLAEDLDLDAETRLSMFCNALDFGERFVNDHADLLVLDLQQPLDLDDAELVLGPGVRRAATRIMGPRPTPPMRTASNHPGGTSPFLSAAKRNGFIDDLRATTLAFPAVTFASIFERLADWVGAQDVARYRFDWPSSAEEVHDTPYLRLRIGPTIPDLVALVADVCRLPKEAARRHVTRLLDRAIDAGGVVPTTGQYDGRVYRIYRKGEGSLRDRSAQRLLWAWQESGLELSLTRASKLLTIMDFATPIADRALSVGSQQRGTVLAYQPDLLDGGGDAVHYWMATGQLTQPGAPPPSDQLPDEA